MFIKWRWRDIYVFIEFVDNGVKYVNFCLLFKFFVNYMLWCIMCVGVFEYVICSFYVGVLYFVVM